MSLYRQTKKSQSYLFKPHLYKGTKEEGNCGEDAPNGHHLQETEREPQLGHKRLYSVLIESKTEKDYKRIDRLNLLGFEGDG